MANFSPISHTGRIVASTKRLGVVQLLDSQFDVSQNGLVSLKGGILPPIMTLTGNSGGAISATAGNINILGTTNQFAFAGSGSTLTGSLSATLVAPGSITSTTTIASGTTITAGTGITSTLGNIVASAGNISATLGSVAAATTVTAGTDITATLGNVIINGAAKQLRVHGGAATDFIGQLTLSTGAATVLNTNIAAGDKIFFSRQDINGSTGIGVEFKYVITPATSFVVTSIKADTTTEANDVSIVNYFIVRQV